MNIQELRIGNYVNHVHKGNFKILKSHFASILINFIHPIPLTEDILLKCGFVVVANYHPEGKTYQFDDFTIMEHYKYLSYRGEGLGNKYVQYLHQLQNIYYSIIGEELNIEL